MEVKHDWSTKFFHEIVPVTPANMLQVFTEYIKKNQLPIIEKILDRAEATPGLIWNGACADVPTIDWLHTMRPDLFERILKLSINTECFFFEPYMYYHPEPFGFTKLGFQIKSPGF